ncbi:hypothetical protein DFJ74DRAFT_675538 [Hyaloraphidium curvatum]|nr:hypothetical protein DFJ74DRAFT_675538 [Hyaloraphidium curvatum]
MEAFQSFVEAHIAPRAPLAVALDGVEGRGYALRLSRDANAGDLLFRIPADALLRAPPLGGPELNRSEGGLVSPAALGFFARAVQDRTGESIGLSNEELPFDDLRLILELIHQRSLGTASPWYGYIAMLPKDFPTCPLYWSDEDTERRLTGAPLYGLAEELRAQLRLAWEWTLDLLSQHLPRNQLESYDWGAFVWAYMVVQSRAFKVRFPGIEGTETVLVPFGDMANHAIVSEDAVVRNLHALDAGTGCLEVVCSRAVNAGDEMTIHYNDLAPWQTLLHYGFSVPTSSPNPYDRINLALAFPDEDSFELESRKLLLFSTVSDLSEEHSLTAEPADNFLASVRVALAVEEELNGLDIEDVADRCFRSSGLGEANERRAVRAAIRMVRSLDSLYPRPFEEDEEALEALEMELKLDGERLADREALRYAVGQRRLLRSVRAWAERLYAALGPGDSDVDSEDE